MFNKLPASQGTGKKNATFLTFVTSVVVHGLLVIGAIALGKTAAEAVAEQPELVDFFEIEETEPEPEPEPEQPEPPAPEPEAPPPVVKGTQELVPPEEPPARIPDVDPTQVEVNVEDFSGVGKLGGVASGVETGVAQDVSRRETPADEGTYDLASVEERPQFRNTSDVQRYVQRNYPPLLRDAGIQGSVQVQFVVGTDGRVEPSSIEVISTDHEQFADVARRAVERMRFSPAKVNNRAVRVLVTMPIQFALAG